MQNKTKLVFKGVTEIVGGSNMGLLILTDSNEKRQIAIVCDKTIEEQINLRLAQVPIKNILLPEVLCSVNPDMNSENYELFFNSISGGQYKVVLFNKITLEMTPIRASDAILLANIANLEIFMDDKLFLKQSVSYADGKNKIALPVNALSTPMLKTALEKAIENENFELASNLRDELQKRKQQDNA
ncbi:UvrB/UvrC motif-containing protein [Prevotella ihumii]|uniref:UvrB/UvrC motif-containing protein n=1 Tax=Prevotella ihumii TaxID=1917878 RepID=UPI0009822361|nr:UvrB/UvrC motif-containing protein [Prevotella ihumii]